MAAGKTRVAYLAGKKMDEEVMLDHQGIPTDNPGVMFEDPKVLYVQWLNIRAAVW